MLCRKAPCLSSSLSTVCTHCWTLTASLYLRGQTQSSSLKGPHGERRTQPPDYRLFELTADKRSGLSPGPFVFFSLFEGFNTEARVGVLKSKVLSWRAAQMSRSVSSAFIRSDGDRRSVSRRRFSTLEMLQEDMKSLLRETRTTGLLSSPLTNVLPRVFMTCSLAIIQCMHLLHMGMHLVWWDGWDDSKNPDITPCSFVHSRVFSLGKLCHGSVTCQMIPTTYLKEIPLRVPAATACLLDAFYHAAGDVLHAQCKVLKRRRYRCTG